MHGRQELLVQKALEVVVVNLAHVGSLVRKKNKPLELLVEDVLALLVGQISDDERLGKHIQCCACSHDLALFGGFLSEVCSIINTSVALETHEAVGVGVLRRFHLRHGRLELFCLISVYSGISNLHEKRLAL